MMDEQLSNGIPRMGLGTYGRDGETGVAALLDALEAGYRRSGLPRSEIFVTTKIADTHLDSPRAIQSVAASLETLGLDALDLLLIHWPSHGDAVPFEDYMGALAEAQARGWARLIGVSNFPIALLRRAETILGTGRIATNQVELHPYLQAPRLTGFAQEAGLPLTAYQPLAKGRVADDPTLRRIADEHGVTAAAISLAFLMAQGHIVIPASSDPERLRGNLAALDVTLSAEDIAAIRALDRTERFIDPDKSPDWDDR